MASHYETLGVPPDADVATLRRAYHDLARRLHPDRVLDADAEARASTAERMRAINEAWRVLGDPTRRRAYDLTLRAVPRREEPEIGDRAVDTPVRAVRGLPWALLIGVLLFIFIVTAYAGGGGPSDRSECVLVTSGPSTTAAPCDRADARRVVAHVDAGAPCPQDTERLQLAREPEALCLSVP